MMRKHTRLIAWVAALLVIVGFCQLGRWQLQRMHEKQALLDQQVPARVQALRLAEALAAPLRLRWVEDRGRYLPGAVLLDNQTRAGRAGFKLYQPFLSEDGARVLVDLGWQPMPPDRVLPRLHVPQGPARIAGLLAPPPASGIALGPALATTPQAGVWLANRLPPDEVARALGLPPRSLPERVLRLDPALPGGYARDLDLLPNTLPPSRHLGYAVQWFALALTVLVVALVLEFRLRRRPAAGSRR